jgi:hypothetical protein
VLFHDPQRGQRWQTLIPHARVEVIGDAGHMLAYEQPDKVVRAVIAFLQRPRGQISDEGNPGDGLWSSAAARV